eukprot:GHVR01191199.1.p1 GENE.GHVR01191199.1~~GHVR01191199.1.p1  ORF type:complete len:226 (-),score=31.52 GHVR01191199.1:229-819(-)
MRDLEHKANTVMATYSSYILTILNNKKQDDLKGILFNILNHKHDNNDVNTRVNTLYWSCKGRETSCVGTNNNNNNIPLCTIHISITRGTSCVGTNIITTNNNTTTIPLCTIPLWHPTMLCEGSQAFVTTMHGHEFEYWKFFVDHFSGYPIDSSGPYPIIQHRNAARKFRFNLVGHYLKYIEVYLPPMANEPLKYPY